jgi:putative flippase GtrA
LGLLQRQRINKFVVYAEFSVVGVANAVVDLGTLNLLLWLWPTAAPAWLALYNTLALILANANSYFWNSIWTFRKQSQRADPGQKTIGFGAQALLNVGVNNILFWVAVELLAATTLPVVVGQNMAKVVSTIGASALSFVVLRYIVFRPRKE